MGLTLPVYLDNHATTRVDPRVIEEMLPYFGTSYGNASSRQHQFGWEAGAAVDLARTRISRLIGGDSEELVFTSGATESINLVLKGVAEGAEGNHIVTCATEHRAVLDTVARLQRYGFRVSIVPVDRFGRVSPRDVELAIEPSTILVSIMAANNEIGTIAPTAEIGALCARRGVLFHVDATQAVGKIPMDVRSMHIDLMSFSAHKMYGPKGVGAAYIRKSGISLAGQMDGGGHERGLRSGTLNVPGIVGFGKAAEIARDAMDSDASRISGLRDLLVERISSTIDGVAINGHARERLPNNAHLAFAGCKADPIMMAMKDVAVSSGSACSSASPEPSHVLKALGVGEDVLHGSIRFGLGRFTTEEEISYTVRRIGETVTALRRHQSVLA